MMTQKYSAWMNGVFISELQQTLLIFLAAFKQSWELDQHVKEIRSKF